MSWSTTSWHMSNINLLLFILKSCNYEYLYHFKIWQHIKCNNFQLGASSSIILDNINDILYLFIDALEACTLLNGDTC